ncbi:ArsR/SmtB family transcription factor [Methanopyrus sp.]
MDESEILRVLRDRVSETSLEAVLVDDVPVDLYDPEEGHAYLVANEDTVERKLGRLTRLVGKVPKASIAYSGDTDELVDPLRRLGAGLIEVSQKGVEIVLEPEEFDADPDVRPVFGHHDELVAVLKALGDERRVAALEVLGHGEECLCKLAEILGESQSSMAYHLKKLLEVGLVTRRSEGGRTFYRLTERGERVLEVIRDLKDRLRRT